MVTGLNGEDTWEETLNDVIVETFHEVTNFIGPNIIRWKIIKVTPEPENSQELIKEGRERLLRAIDYVASLSQKRGNKFLIANKVRTSL